MAEIIRHGIYMHLALKEGDEGTADGQSDTGPFLEEAREVVGAAALCAGRGTGHRIVWNRWLETGQNSRGNLGKSFTAGLSTIFDFSTGCTAVIAVFSVLGEPFVGENGKGSQR